MALNYSEKDFSYFMAKYHRRLYRQLVQYETMSRHLPETLQNRSEKIIKMLDLPEDTVKNVELKDHAEKSCLIGLKAEFELFFYVFALFMANKILNDAEQEGRLSDPHQGVIRCVQNVKEYYEDFVKGGFRDAKKLFIEKALPDYGLDRMLHFLVQCGINIQNILHKVSPEVLQNNFKDAIQNELRPFFQVRTAFQVRHAIEHSFSRVGENFIYKLGSDWKYSTWHRRFSPTGGPKLGERILVDSVDIHATACAMSQLAQNLKEIWEKFSKQGLPGIESMA